MLQRRRARRNPRRTLAHAASACQTARVANGGQPYFVSGIFLSYRRNDSAGHAGRLYDRLIEHFGHALVFMDVDTIRAGEDFTRVLSTSMSECEVVVAVIGPQWLNAQDGHGARRLLAADDYVRLEVATAIARGIPVVPVLVEGAPPPPRGALPDVIAPLANFQALTISDDRFHAETSDLIARLEQILKRTPDTGVSPRWKWLAGIAAILVVAALLWFAWMQRGNPHNDPVATIDGRWNAEVTDREHTFRIVLDLQSSGGHVLGTVTYPTGIGAIRDGTVQGDHVSFSTVHTPQFEDQEAVTRFEGELQAQTLNLVMQTSQAVRKFQAVKQAP